MGTRVVAIGLDAADPDIVEPWIRAGKLPNLARLVDEGAYGRLRNHVAYLGDSAPLSSTEAAWVMLQTGVGPNTSGYWDVVEYDSLRYRSTFCQNRGGYDYRHYQPFFALGDEFRVAAFDLPVSAIVPGVDGLQLQGWGGHFPFVKPGSSPTSLLKDIVARYGSNEVLYRDHGVFWNPRYLKWLEESSIRSARTRGQICRDLLDREPWDLFLAVFGETHGASHDLWFASDREHVLHSAWGGGHDPLLSVFQAIDGEIGSLMERAGSDVTFACYSAHGMQANVTDLFCFLVLPELLYRFSFPGRFAIARGGSGPPRPPFTQGRHAYWFEEIWKQRVAGGALRQRLQSLLPAWLTWAPHRDLHFPYLSILAGPQAGWMPALWYQKAWPRMRCFSLPSFADGHVRINLQGRESQGIVCAADYSAECDRISEFLLSARNGRTGRPIVRDVLRTRSTAGADDPRLPHADLVVLWEEGPADVVDSPHVGRIGPVPFYRTGGHRNEGFLALRGPGVAKGANIEGASVLDIAPTLLRRLGARIPDHFEGGPLFP